MNNLVRPIFDRIIELDRKRQAIETLPPEAGMFSPPVIAVFLREAEEIAWEILRKCRVEQAIRSAEALCLMEDLVRALSGRNPLPEPPSPKEMLE